MTAPADSLTRDLRRCRRGDEMAARRLYARAGGAMEMVAFACTNDRADAQDAVQLALVRVLATPMERVDEVREALPWLVKITRNVAINSCRSESRRGARERVAISRNGVHQNGAHHNGAPVGAPDELRSAIGALSLEHREVVILKDFIGLTWVQIGDTIGLTDSACAARHRAALGILRTTLTRGQHVPDSGVKP